MSWPVPTPMRQHGMISFIRVERNRGMAHQERVLSGMRATGALHLGHYHGVLKNWLELQLSHECFFFVADWHALTTHYAAETPVSTYIHQVVVDWLSVGIDPNHCHVFVQSHVPEHAVLHLLLSMMTPLSWLERVPTYKDQQEALKEHDLATYGFLGYPLLQSADILLYKPDWVPVGEDQKAHLDLTRDVARRFNALYGREKNFTALCEDAFSKMGKKNAKLYKEWAHEFQTHGTETALRSGLEMLANLQNISAADHERLQGYLQGTGKTILPEPNTLLAPYAKMPGLDGRKMSKSYGNTIALREDPATVRQKIKVMPTDPARVRRTDPGEPTRCPVYALHQVYSSEETQEWVVKGCRSAGIGCLDCKQAVCETIVTEQAPFIERGGYFEQHPELITDCLEHGKHAAQKVARQTLQEVQQAMGL